MKIRPNKRDEHTDMVAAAVVDAQRLAETLGDEVQSINNPKLPPRSTPQNRKKDWNPALNPTQRKIFDDTAKYILGYGEKGSGKSIGFGHKVIRHAYDNDNALVLIISPTIRTGNFGIWYDLETLVLPAWRDGNKYPEFMNDGKTPHPKAGTLMDEGIGLEYTHSALDPLTKDRHRWIRNRHGGWSCIVLMSIPHATMVETRIKGPAPSMVYVEELTNCDGREYFSKIAMQLGRRRGNKGAPQQYCASCNPEGPSHWVYKEFLEKVEAGKTQYSVFHVPIAENLQHLTEGYHDEIKDLTENDNIEYRRLVLGEWIDRPTGEGIFKEYFIPTLHIKPSDPKQIILGVGLLPIAGYPIILGYDLGSVFSSVTFLQRILKPSGTIWFAFDEVDHLNQRILYKTLAWEIIERMKFWQKRVTYEFKYQHITDESAINVWRPGSEGGTYDSLVFEREFNRVQEQLNQHPAKLLGCPKGPGSVSGRVQLLQGKLLQEEFFVSGSNCPNTREMLMFLEADKNEPEKPKRSKFLHKFDSVTYPMWRAEVAGGFTNLPQAEAAPTLSSVGT